MKTSLTLLAALLFLASCANVFDSNLLQPYDTPPALDSSKLANASVADLTKQSKDPSFILQLKKDPAARKAVQKVLKAGMKLPANPTAAEKAAAAVAAKSFINITANATPAMGVTNNVLGAFSSVITSGPSASNFTDVAQLQATAASLFAGVAPEDLPDTLANMADIAGAFGVLDSVATDSSDFFAGSNPGDLAQIGVVAGAVNALMSSVTGADLTTDAGTAAAAQTVADLISSPDPTTYISTNFDAGTGGALDTQFGDLIGALTGTPAAGNQYAYLATVKTALPTSTTGGAGI